jgi:homocysteine S-methyltransferase
MSLFEQALAQHTTILLDGGLATELEAQGQEISSSLWSASLLKTNPEAIIKAHLAYLRAGAQCIISASYQASRNGFIALGLSETDADALITSSVTLAQKARDIYLAENPLLSYTPMIAASVGPFGATLHDGSEYYGKYEIDQPGLRHFHRERLQLLDNSGADVLACETIPSMTEAAVLAELLQDVKTPAWISFSCRDSHCISDGTPLGRAAALFKDHPRVLAIGVNCTPAHLISPLIMELCKAAPGKAIVVYPNSGEKYEAATYSWSGALSPIESARSATIWRDAGAQIIGGCCRMGPSHIAAIRENLANS